MPQGTTGEHYVLTEVIDVLANDSLRRIAVVRDELSQRFDNLDETIASKIAIYATGSLARHEANKFSDLDAFFYVLGSRDRDKIDPVHEIEIFHHVIQTGMVANFPDFSGGGEYLHFQYLDDVVDNIGSRHDDYINALTSRMLLILESAYLFNEKPFNAARSKIIERYFADFHDHSEDFQPIFILNDVLRFWRTLCLNYEHGREWRREKPEERARGHLKNLKLRFSRLMICYSFIGALLQRGPALNPEQVLDVSIMTPVQRLQAVSTQDCSLKADVDAILGEYSWFLEAMNREKHDVLEWILDDVERVDAFAKSKVFIESMYRLITRIAEQHGYIRYLVI
jgi:hypothetical protein